MTPLESLVSVMRDVRRALAEDDLSPERVEDLLDTIAAVMALPEIAAIDNQMTLESLD